MAQSKREPVTPEAKPSTAEVAGAEQGGEMGRAWTVGLGAYLVGLSALCGNRLVSIWGNLQVNGADATAAGGGFASDWTVDVQLFVAVILAGATGSLLHAIQSYTMYIAHRRLFRRWLAWYALRPFIGAMIAGLLFLIVRGGLLTTGNEIDALNGLIALGAIGGMFSEPATKRLNEVAYAVFGTTRDKDGELKQSTPDRGGDSGDGSVN